MGPAGYFLDLVQNSHHFHKFRIASLFSVFDHPAIFFEKLRYCNDLGTCCHNEPLLRKMFSEKKTNVKCGFC